MTPFMMGTTSSITMQILRKIAQCAPAVGAKMWCFFVTGGMPRSQTSGFSPPQGRLVAPIQVKLCSANGHLRSAWCCKISHQSTQRCGNVAPKISKISTFLVNSRFRKCLGVLRPLSILHSCFKFHVIRITSYGVIAEKPRVGILGQIFPCTL